ncbi:response regulator [Planctomicrobium sp. SH661]|uniref:response regulator n=1 Tax=Planctomicrobium sp. SH661 TaxID=3448124 RepID=UPI003F5CA9E2
MSVSDETRSRPRILIAEDTPMFQTVMRRCLEQLGCEIVVKGDGRQALDLLLEDPVTFQLLVSDLEMPELDGFSLVREIRAHPVLGSLPVIACSSRTEPEYEAQALAAGFDAYLVKLNEEQLKKTAALWLVRGIRRQPVRDLQEQG